MRAVSISLTHFANLHRWPWWGAFLVFGLLSVAICLFSRDRGKQIEGRPVDDWFWICAILENGAYPFGRWNDPPSSVTNIIQMNESIFQQEVLTRLQAREDSAFQRGLDVGRRILFLGGIADTDASMAVNRSHALSVLKVLGRHALSMQQQIDALAKELPEDRILSLSAQHLRHLRLSGEPTIHEDTP